MHPAIAAFSITRSFDDLLAVDGVTLEVSAGEVFGLLGPNGAGKTTLLRMLAGVLEPASGRAEILGHDVQSDPIAAKRALGFLSGDTALYGRLTVRETLRYFGRLHGLDDEVLARRVDALEGELGLSDFLDRRAGQLSTGQTQRANLARAFLPDPPVLILDEPTLALDVISGRFVHDAIRDGRSRGKALILSTHIMSEAVELCDRIAIMLRGRLRAVGKHEDLLERFGARSLTELILELDREAHVGP